jgi:hypothetical protein
MDGSLNPQSHPLHKDASRISANLHPAQATQAQPDGEAAAMSDASGNVVAFDPASVSLRKLTCL